MADAPQVVKVEHNGAEIEIPREALKDFVHVGELGEKYVPKAVHNSEFAKIRKSMEGLRNPDELLEDAEFRERFVRHHGLNPDASKQMQVELQKLKTDIDTREIKPRDAKLSKMTEKVTKLQEKDKIGQIVQAAAAAGAKKSLLKASIPGVKPPIVALVESAFEYDEEHGDWFAKSPTGQGFAYSTKGGASPYKNIAEFIAEWAVDPSNADWLETTRQGGPSAAVSGDASRQQVGKRFRVGPEVMADPRAYKAARAEADRLGLELEIVR